MSEKARKLLEKVRTLHNSWEKLCGLVVACLDVLLRKCVHQTEDQKGTRAKRKVLRVSPPTRGVLSRGGTMLENNVGER